MELINSNITEVLIILGLGLLILEVMILGFSTFVLFFLGLGCVLAGALMFLNIVPETGLYAYISVAALTSGLALLLWQPLKNMQNKVEHKTVKSELIGLTFVLDKDISPSDNAVHLYSGIEWQVKSAETLNSGTEVKVIKTDVGTFTVIAT